MIEERTATGSNGSRRTQVVIAGGGPVGVSLAIGLAQRGIASTVIERRETLQQVPKGQNLTQRTLEHFRDWGIADELRAARTTGRDSGGLTAYGSLLGDYHYPWMQREQVAEYYAAGNERLPQYRTEEVLRRRAAELPLIELLTGWTVAEVDDRADRVTVLARNRNGESITVEAEYAVGCDGSKSVLREEAGISQTSADHDRLMALIVFRSPEFDRIMRRFPGVAFVNVMNPELDGYWQFFGRVDETETWFFHAPVDPGTTVDTIDVAAVLSRAAGASFAFEIEHLGFWELRFALADRYRSGRCFIAGDAAHSHPPYGGYGINSGFEDGANLAWKIAARLQGWAGPGLLDSYDEERRPVFGSTRDAFIARSIDVDRAFLRHCDPVRDLAAFEAAWQARANGTAGEVDAFEPNYAGSPIVAAGPAGASPSAVGEHRHEARPGHHLAPGVTADGGEVFAALGRGFALLLVDEAGAAPFRAAAEARGIPLDTVLIDAESAARYGAAQILVRPDRFVAWVDGDGPVDADAVLSRASGGE